MRKRTTALADRLSTARPAAGAGAVQRRGSVLHAARRSDEGDSGVSPRGGARLHELPTPPIRSRALRIRATTLAPNGCSGSRSRAIRRTERLLANLAGLYTVMGGTRRSTRCWRFIASRSASLSDLRRPLRRALEPARLRRRGAARARAGGHRQAARALWTRRTCWSAIAWLRGRLHEAERRFAQVNEAKARVARRHGEPVQRGILSRDARWPFARRCRRADSPRSTRRSARRRWPPFPLARDRACGWRSATPVSAPRRRRDELMTSMRRGSTRRARRQEAVFLARLRGMIALAEGKSDSAIAYFRTRRRRRPTDCRQQLHRLHAAPHRPRLRSRRPCRLRARVSDEVRRDDRHRRLSRIASTSRPRSTAWASCTRARATRSTRRSTTAGSWICGRTPIPTCSRAWRRRGSASSG